MRRSSRARLDSASLFRGDVLRDNPYPELAIVRTEMVQLVRLLPRYRFGNMPRILAQYRMHRAQKTNRLAGLAAYRQCQLQEQLFSTCVPEADASERATFALVAGTNPLGREELLAIADLFVRRLWSPDAEARQRVLLHSASPRAARGKGPR